MTEVRAVVTLQPEEGDNGGPDGELGKIIEAWGMDTTDLVLIDDTVEVRVSKVEPFQDEIDRAVMGERERIRRLAINRGLNDFAVYLRDENL